jgi:DNA ligase-1
MKNLKKNMTTFKPMLAHPVSKTIDWKNETHFIQPKLDGVRCIITRYGAYSRNNKQFHNCKHILTELKPLFDDNPYLILDGELYNHKFKDNFNKIISLVRKQKPTQQDKFEAASYLQFHCYDLFSDYVAAEPADSFANLKFIDRTLAITNLKSKYKLKFTHEVDTKVIWNDDELNKYHKQNKANGYEGSMLRTNSLYEQKRSYTLQKVKDWSDTEITITDYIEGKGKFKNGLGKFIGVDSNNQIVEVPWPSLTILDRKGIWHNRASYIGKQLTFEYFERTPSGAYRFPRAKTVRNYE